MNPNQSGFRPSNLCVNQLIAITPEIFGAFDCNPPLKVREFQENFITFLKIKQRVVLNGQMSSWKPVIAGVPPGSILGPLLFLIYINDLPNELKSHAKLFADDTSLFTIVKDKNVSANILNKDLSLISKWAYDWKMLFNPEPSKPAQEVLFSRKRQVPAHLVLITNNIQVERVPCQKHLGI